MQSVFVIYASLPPLAAFSTFFFSDELTQWTNAVAPPRVITKDQEAETRKRFPKPGLQSSSISNNPLLRRRFNDVLVRNLDEQRAQKEAEIAGCENFDLDIILESHLVFRRSQKKGSRRATARGTAA